MRGPVLYPGSYVHINIQYQCAVPKQGVVYPLWSEVERVGVVDGRVACPTFMQKSGVCIPSQISTFLINCPGNVHGKACKSLTPVISLTVSSSHQPNPTVSCINAATHTHPSHAMLSLSHIISTAHTSLLDHTSHNIVGLIFYGLVQESSLSGAKNHFIAVKQIPHVNSSLLLLKSTHQMWSSFWADTVWGHAGQTAAAGESLLPDQPSRRRGISLSLLSQVW